MPARWRACPVRPRGLHSNGPGSWTRRFLEGVQAHTERCGSCALFPAQLEELSEGRKDQHPGQGQLCVRLSCLDPLRHAHEGGRFRATEKLRASHAVPPRPRGSRASAANWSVGRSSRVISRLRDRVLPRGSSCCYHVQQDSSPPSTRGEPSFRGPLSPFTFEPEVRISGQRARLAPSARIPTTIARRTSALGQDRHWFGFGQPDLPKDVVGSCFARRHPGDDLSPQHADPLPVRVGLTPVNVGEAVDALP